MKIVPDSNGNDTFHLTLSSNRNNFEMVMLVGYIAAGQAILESAGGAIITNRKQRLRYNESKSYLNPNFVASSSKELSLHILSEIE